MIDLYTAPTPNGFKASIALEEMRVPYTVHALSLGASDQRKPDYLKINPNGRIPAIIDRNNDDFAVFESGAILVYLAEMSGIGPMQGQANVFVRYFDVELPDVIARYQNETRRLFEVLEEQLAGRDYLCGDYSIADIANWAWVRSYKWARINVDGLKNLMAWDDRIAARPGCQRGTSVPPRETADETVKMARSMLRR